MKILVAIKRVPDFKTSVRLKADGSGIETSQVKMVINPFDEIAVEEAVRLKEKGLAQEVVVVTLGTSAAQESLRAALAMGADRSLLVELPAAAETQALEPLMAAKILQTLVLKEAPELVILGKQAVDTDNNQTGQMLAALLDWPQATFASQVEVQGKEVQVTREIDGGLETLVLTLPAVITTDLRLNEPRYLSLPNIVQAKKKPLEELAFDSLGLPWEARHKLLKLTLPQKQRAHITVTSSEELVRRLKEEAKVLP